MALSAKVRLCRIAGCQPRCGHIAVGPNNFQGLIDGLLQVFVGLWHVFFTGGRAAQGGPKVRREQRGFSITSSMP